MEPQKGFYILKIKELFFFIANLLSSPSVKLSANFYLSGRHYEEKKIEDLFNNTIIPKSKFASFRDASFLSITQKKP